MDDAFALRLRAEMDRRGPEIHAECAEIARAVLERPPKRGRALASVLAEVLRPFVNSETPDAAERAAWSARVRKLPKADQAVVDHFVMRLHKNLFDAIVNAAPAELRQALEEVRIR